MGGKVFAQCNLHGHELNDIPVVNPGDHFGKTWLIEIGGSYSPFFVIVEAASMSSAIDELADSESFGHHIVVTGDDLADYDPEDCHYGPSGQVLDLDHIMIHGAEGASVPFPCRYFGPSLPIEGVLPTEFCWDEIED